MQNYDEGIEYREARQAWNNWIENRLSLNLTPRHAAESFPEFLESNWAWASFKAGWDASRRIRNTILKVDELGRKRTL